MVVSNALAKSARNWTGSIQGYGLVWGLPHAAIVAGLFATGPIRTAMWAIALMWMGPACVLNAARCGRTHCRYTGPYYLAMIVPVLILGLDIVPVGIYGWIVLGVVIVGGAKLIWFATERAWGTFS